MAQTETKHTNQRNPHLPCLQHQLTDARLEHIVTVRSPQLPVGTTSRKWKNFHLPPTQTTSRVWRKFHLPLTQTTSRVWSNFHLPLTQTTSRMWRKHSFTLTQTTSRVWRKHSFTLTQTTSKVWRNFHLPLTQTTSRVWRNFHLSLTQTTSRVWRKLSCTPNTDNKHLQIQQTAYEEKSIYLYNQSSVKKRRNKTLVTNGYQNAGSLSSYINLWGKVLIF